MPLTPVALTVASRVMLPTYVALFGWVGGVYVADPPRLQESPALAYAATLMPLPMWGIWFLTVAALMAVALAGRRTGWARQVYTYALWTGIVTMTVWAVVFAAAALTARASPGAAAWPGFAAVACYASYRSLQAGER